MGGHGAMWLSFRHKDVFGAAGSTSGGVDIRPFPNNWNMSDWLGKESENQEIWDNHTAINQIDRLKMATWLSSSIVVIAISSLK